MRQLIKEVTERRKLLRRLEYAVNSPGFAVIYNLIEPSEWVRLIKEAYDKKDNSIFLKKVAELSSKKLETMPTNDLRTLARSKWVANYSRLTRDQLIDAMTEETSGGQNDDDDVNAGDHR